MSDDLDTDISTLSFLVVDDEAFIQKLAVRILGGMGAADIATASNGVEALEYLQAVDSEPDVLLVDLSMPVMGGVELLKNLAEKEFGGAVILASGADPETLAIAEGMAKYRNVNLLGYITKPVTPQALTEILRKLNQEKNG